MRGFMLVSGSTEWYVSSGFDVFAVCAVVFESLIVDRVLTL